MSSHGIHDLDGLAAAIPDGAKLAIPAEYSGVAVAATLALIRRGARRLHLVCVPVSGLQADLLIGAGAVVHGSIRDSVIWPGATVDAGETLSRVIRAAGVTVQV